MAKGGLEVDSRVHVAEAKAEDVPFPDGQFDVVSTLSFDHWRGTVLGRRGRARTVRHCGRLLHGAGFANWVAARQDLLIGRIVATR